MLTLGGNTNGVLLLKQNGATPTHALIWCGTWTNVNADGSIPQVDSHIAWCKQNGVRPAIMFYYWGDAISDALLQTGDGNKTPAKWWALGKAIARRVALGNIPDSLVILESEWNKNGVTPTVWDPMARDMASTIKTLAPNAKIVSSPGSWSDPVSLYQRYPGIASTSDLLGTQFLRGLTKTSPADFDGTADAILAYFEKLHAAQPTKALILTDFAMATCGNITNCASGPTVAGSTEEARVAAVIQKLATYRARLEAANVSLIILREPKDNSARPAASNYFGCAEYYMGFAYRIDGSTKSTLAPMLALATPSMPPPPPPDVAALQAQVADLTTKLATAQAQAASLQANVDALTTKIQKARNDLA